MAGSARLCYSGPVLRPLGPGPLTLVHEATIAIAAVGCLVYAAWDGRNFRATGDVGSALASLAGVGGVVVTVLYLRILLRQPPSGG